MLAQASLFDGGNGDPHWAEPIGPAAEADLADLPDAELRYQPGFLATDVAARLHDEVLATTAWRHESLPMYGRMVDVPRLSAWYGERRATYRYSGLHMDPRPWTPALLEVKAAVEAELDAPFNSVLANLYRDGRDSVAWHADDEAELGPCPLIASVSLGGVRRFDLRHAADHTLRRSLDLPPGSLLVMAGPTQRHWQHRVAKTAKPVAPRINLTFRQIRLA